MTAKTKTKTMDPRAYELGDVTRYYREVAPPELLPLLDEYSLRVVSTGRMTDGLGGLLDPAAVRPGEAGMGLLGPGQVQEAEQVFPRARPPSLFQVNP
mgnify:CR=1 FL=1